MVTRELLGRASHPLLRRLKDFNTSDLFRLPARPARRVPTRPISVVIPAHNEEAYIAQTLESLRRQNYGWMEVVVVANGCTDNTAEAAQRLCDRLIVLSQKSLGVSRNLGARMARGEILVFLDADTTLEPMALRRIAEVFGTDCAAGTLRGQPDRPESKYQLVYFLKNLAHRTSLHTGSSGVIICWKEHFMRSGGFDERLEVRENSELIRRLLRFGKYQYVGDVSATTSMRRYQQRGVLRLGWLWLRLWMQSWFGDLHRRHYEIVR
ncbi:MAG TPA: glycosyltransferase [Clostridia bacterium]|nr:glycosyltransferase [Clostridia bacterium]